MATVHCVVLCMWMAYSSLASWAREQGKVVVEEALWGRQGVPLESDRQQRRSGTSGKKHPTVESSSACIVPPQHFNPSFSSLCFLLQAEGEGADGGAEEASRRGDWPSQKGDWAPTEGDRPPQGQNQKAKTWWLKLGSLLWFLLQRVLPFLFACKSMLIKYWLINCWSRHVLYDTNMKIKCFIFEHACHSLVIPLV